MRSYRFWLLLVLAILILSSPAFAQVIINEIMYNPPGDDYHTEYIELFNLGDEPVFLYGWRISDGSQANYLIPIPDSNQLTIDSAGYAVVIDPGYWQNGMSLYDDQIPPDALIITIDDSRFGVNGLSNSESETVQLHNDDGEVVSQRSYLPDANGGISEERILPIGGESDGNWAFSASGGTPGYLNSVTPPQNDLSVKPTVIQVDYDEQLDRNTIITEWLVRNEGRDTSEERQLTFSLRSEYSGFDSTMRSMTLSPTAPEWATTIPHTFSARVPTDTYSLLAILSPQDDLTENDTARVDVYLRGKTDLSDDWFAFSEVMLNPPDAPSSKEWIELRVTRGVAFNPSGWGVMDAAGVIAQFPPTLTLLQPGSLYVLAETPSVLNWEGLRSDQIFVPYTWPQLNNYGEVLTIVTPDSTEYLSVGVDNGYPGVSMHWYENESTETAWQPTHYPPYATPGRENWIVYPDRDLALNSIECVLDLGDSPNAVDDTLNVAIEVSLDGWFVDDGVSWTVTASYGGMSIPLGTTTSTAPEPTGSTTWTAQLDPTQLNVPAEWTITAQFENSDANPANNELSATIDITEVYDPASLGTHASVVEVSPNPFSPDGDGYEDITEFHFDYPAEAIAITIRLFDSTGRPLGTIASDEQLPGTGTWSWNGRSGLSNRSFLPLGLYAYVIDIRSADGEQQWRVKGALASAGGR